VISVGLELGNHSVKVAVLDGARGSFKLRGFEVHKIDAKKGEAEDDIVSVVEEALKRLKAPRGQVVASIRAQDCTIREITVPFTEDDKIRKTVKYQAENYFTSMSIDDAIIEYSKFAVTADGKSKLMVAGIKKAHLERRLDFLRECAIDPTAIDLDVAALFNTYAHLSVFEGKGAVLLVDIEADTLKIGVVEDGKLRLARSVRMQLADMRLEKTGGRPKPGADDSGVFDTAADESARLPVVILDEGEDEAFSLEDSGISEIEREGIIHRVFMEIDRTVASVNLTKEVEQICLSGASCSLEGIEDLFTEHFELPATRVDLSEPFGAAPDKKTKEEKETSLSLQAGVALGLALKGLGVDHAGMDFRQEEFSFRGTFALLKRGVACALTLSFALVFLYAFALKQDLRERKNGVVGVKTLQKNLYTVLFPNLEDLVNDHQPLRVGQPEEERYFESLQAEERRLKTKFSGGGGGNEDGPTVSALDVLRQFAEAKAKLTEKNWVLEVVNVQVDARRGGGGVFECVGTQQEAGITLGQQFSGNPNLVADVRSTEDKRSGKWRFTVVIKLTDKEKG
jgi:type IV pilus assembly protein PilM